MEKEKLDRCGNFKIHKELQCLHNQTVSLLPQSPPSKKRKLEKPRKPITFTVLESTTKALKNKVASSDSVPKEDIEVVTAGIEKILTDLKVLYKRVPCGKGEVSLFLTAIQNSWIHVRRKKRDRVRQLRELPRAESNVLKSTGADQTTGGQCGSTNIGSVSVEEKINVSNCAESNVEIGKPTVEAEEELPINGGNSSLNKLHVDQENNAETEKKFNQCEISFVDCKTDDTIEHETPCSTMANTKVEDTPRESEGCFLFKCLMNVKKDGKNSHVEMHWVEGQNRDLMNQLSTYLRNQIFKLVVS
ncbi:RNA N6-adenosine-methyltransferase METTL16-like [Rhincodon typus]|uniref:RNA N6-adenosine-methyltransferase METTL16-like n=1 Tax=Rhincodon typus TaxID=259920 RepID=UPI00202FCF9D|nr:RNA N6-adenosine-methyltransferase METTL16-like [Rhincodon typus]